eukprot:7107348-Pyramimonas_sp.AAC.1
MRSCRQGPRRGQRIVSPAHSTACWRRRPEVQPRRLRLGRERARGPGCSPRWWRPNPCGTQGAGIVGAGSRV